MHEVLNEMIYSLFFFPWLNEVSYNQKIKLIQFIHGDGQDKNKLEFNFNFNSRD